MNKIYLIILTLGTYLQACMQSSPSISIVLENEQLIISGKIPQEVNQLAIQFHSNRNKTISSYNEVSLQNPDAEKTTSEFSKRNWDIFYPVVDIGLNSSISGVGSFDLPIDSMYSINGMFHETFFDLQKGKASIDNQYLQQWENNLYINDGLAKMKGFYMEDIIEVKAELDLNYPVLSPDWNGLILLINPANGDTLANQPIVSQYKNPTENSLGKYADDGLSRNRLLKSLAATVHFTLGTQDHSPHGKTKNGLNLFYDLEAKTYRRPTWVWGTGPSIKLLLEAAKYPEIANQFSKEKLLTTAIEVGEVALPLQIKDSSSTAYGVVISRWSENRGTLKENYGFEEYYSVADAQFLVGWGWIPLYEATKDERFLEGARLMTDATGRLTQEFELTPMDYMVRAGRWKDYALNEQGFGTEGINELNRVEPKEEYQKIGHEYMQMLLKKFDTKSGIWNRMYRINKQLAEPTRYHTRGVGWAMEGLIAAYELTQRQEYLGKAIKMGDHLIRNQLENGSWSYDFSAQNPEEISEKGTALWSLLFYKLYFFTEDPDHLSAARNALLWCLNNQYDGPDPHAFGGVVGISRQSGVIYRHFFPLACTYTSGFFGLATLEELKLQENES